MRFIELFSGSGTVTEVFKENGFETVSIDIRKRKGVCEPDYKMDINDIVSLSHFFCNDHHNLFPDVIFSGIPCNVWSYASNASRHWVDGKPNTDSCKKYLDLTNHTLHLIKEAVLQNNAIYFIENPRARLRKYQGLLDFLQETNGEIYECTLSSFGHPTTKPTNIFSNIQIEMPKLDPFGRGNKSPGHFDNMTTCQRQKTPRRLAEFLYEQLENDLTFYQKKYF